MAEKTGATLDMRQWHDALDRLVGPARESLARSMAVAGGRVLRDEARLRAPVGPSGNLSRAIYLAYRDRESSPAVARYQVTWNRRVAPHGHLVEFGYWQPYVVVKINGEWVTTKTPRLHAKQIPAYPFLRPAYEARGAAAIAAMLARGRERLPQLLAGEASRGS